MQGSHGSRATGLERRRFVTYSSPRDQASWGTSNLAYRPISGDRSQEVIMMESAGLQMAPRIAPGGSYLAYSSDESGRFEIYLTRFPSGDGRRQVSVSGGMWARWNGRGDRLYYVNGDDLMAVDVHSRCTRVWT